MSRLNNFGRVPAPKAARVTTRSILDLILIGLILLCVGAGLGFIYGQKYQQKTFDDAVEKRRQLQEQQLTAPAGPLSWLSNGKEMDPLDENPNCVLYRKDKCPMDPIPVQPPQPAHCVVISIDSKGVPNYDCRAGDRTFLEPVASQHLFS